MLINKNSILDGADDSRGRINTISKGTSGSQTDIVSYEYIGSRVGRRVYDDTDATCPVTYSIEYGPVRPGGPALYLSIFHKYY